MFGFPYDIDTQTKQGHDKLSVMVHFMQVLSGEEIHKFDRHFNRLKSYLVSLIKRGITKQEELNLMEGIWNYFKTEGGTNERMKAMNYLFDLEFLEEQQQ